MFHESDDFSFESGNRLLSDCAVRCIMRTSSNLNAIIELKEIATMIINSMARCLTHRVSTQAMRISLAFGMVIMMMLTAWTVLAMPVQQVTDNLLQRDILDTRVDMELLADLVFGGGRRPDTWTGNLDIESESIIADLWFDNEQLASEVFGDGVRPDGWVSATTNEPDLITRNIRHDLELIASEFIGEDVRPSDWVGGDPITRCNRSLMNVTNLLEEFYGVSVTTTTDVLDFCTTVAFEISDDLLSQVYAGSTEEETVPANTLAIRGDLERLADETLGLGTRPEGWIGNKDINSEALARDIFSDIERLADTLVGIDQRPTGWLGTLAFSELETYRFLRADLELLADIGLGPDIRPRGWQGESRLVRCDADLQNLVSIIERNFQQFTGETSSTATNINTYCDEVWVATNNFAENLPDPVVEGEDPVAEDAPDTRYLGTSEFAFAYLNVSATEYMGVMPAGTEFRAWYRNFNESTMMFVSGVDFALYIDRRWTTLSDNTFATLPTLEGIQPLAFCDASWCNGPGPTPTSTGDGVIYEIIVGVTPPATIAPSDVQGEGKQLVSWNHIRVNYILQRPEIGRAQVTLEICQTTAQVACEPVISVFDNALGQAVPVVSQFNGLNVYELAYGYTTNLLVEGTTLFSQDIWLNDPSLGGTIPTATVPPQ